MATTSLSDLNALLPVGNFSLLVTISDMLGGITAYELGNVTAILPTEDQMKKSDYMNYITYLSSTGDQVALGMALTALSSIRDNLESFSLNEELLANFTDKEFEGRILDVAEVNKNQLKLALDTMSFNSVPQIEIGANIVQQALASINNDLAGTLTIDMESKENALLLLEKMTERIPEINYASPMDLLPYATSTMDSVSTISFRTHFSCIPFATFLTIL